MDYTEYKYLPDGTYQVSRVTGQVENYGEKWAYGYIVGIKPLDRAPNFGELFGVWQDPLDGSLSVDFVEHVGTLGTATRLATERGEDAIYDLREGKVIYL